MTRQNLEEQKRKNKKIEEQILAVQRKNINAVKELYTKIKSINHYYKELQKRNSVYS